jgi:hypothetical protein
VAGQFGFSQEQIDIVVRRQLGLPAAQQGADSQETDDGSLMGLGSLAERRMGRTETVEALGPIAKIIGIAILLFSATGVFAQLQLALFWRDMQGREDWQQLLRITTVSVSSPARSRCRKPTKRRLPVALAYTA